MSTDYLKSRLAAGFVPGLQNITSLCAEFGNPQKKFESIHIVGTNGKGSTVLYTANILQAHKLKVGLFTSPHLVSVRERFRINKKFISQKKLDDLLKRIEKSAVQEPSYFEVLTAAAFLWFAENKIDIAVLEAGLGGRLDSTKIAEGKIVALTSVGLDHTEILGDTLEKIKKEKLGIMSKNAVLIKPKKITPILQVGNYGKIYVKNAELAFATAKAFLGKSFNESTARIALSKSVWVGRMQFIPTSKTDFILDGAHNPQAAAALADCLKEKSLPPLPCIFASLSDKDTKGVLKILKPHISICYCAPIDNPRARTPEEIAAICKELKIKSRIIENIVLHPTSLPTLITGSLYLVGAAIKKLCETYDELSEFRGLETFPNETLTIPSKKNIYLPTQTHRNISAY